VTGRIRMVGTVQVNFPDASSNQDTLFQLSGLSCVAAGAGSLRTPAAGFNCTPATVPSALQPLVTARDRYGADLMSLVRNFNDPENGSCGVGWLIGAGQKPITSADAPYGVSIVSDSNGSAFPDNGNTCREVYLVHELGHNMGLQHDRASAAGSDDTDGDGNVLDPEEYGAFPYSFGLNADASHGNFYTVMSLVRAGQTGYAVFSNPNITSCGGFACGVADHEDNARALRLTMPIALLTCMIDGIWKVFASRIRLATAPVTSSTSSAAMRPPPILRHSVCAMTPFSDSDSMIRICACRSDGNWSMMRSTVDAAVVVWSVPNTR